MPTNTSSPPRAVPQVMVSSTFTDLKKHRAALISAINAHGLHPKVMDDSARLVDVIESSLQMVRESAAYILVISKKYGQTPVELKRNPDNLSITELEFNEAVRLGRPTLLFIMGEDHYIRECDIEQDAGKKKKLNAFRERAKQASPGSSVHRVYAVFKSLGELKNKMNAPLAELETYLRASEVSVRKEPTTESTCFTSNAIPTPPAFYAETDYIGSHEFVGRDSQLEDLNEWAKAADPTNLLLFEAIGGNGKSMLTWEWSRKRAPTLRDWAGCFWYSFYERGAVMADFCRRALTYMTGRPLEELEKMPMHELSKELLVQLHVRPWLLILDGLERVLVAYHRIDAAEVPDEDANASTDKVFNRNPCDTIRDEDGDLLRALAAAIPSKILVSSRLTPRKLLNPSGQPIPGAKRITLPGLRPADAEKLLCSCGIRGDSERIQDYLTQNCDNHPLVIGVLAGLITNYLPNRGNFDAWLADTGSQGGADLNLASLDLIQRRNHILRAALDALPEKSRHLLSTLAFISASVDYETLAAFNPHLPPTQIRLAETIKELEQRGLLQYDRSANRYDLHPVVRGVAAGRMKVEEKERCGQRVVDHFSALPHDPYEQAKSLADVAPGLHVVRTLLKLGRFQEAADAYVGNLSNALFTNLEAYIETISLLQPFFPSGWGELPKGVDATDASYIANDAAICFEKCGEFDTALAVHTVCLQLDMAQKDWASADTVLRNFSNVLIHQNYLVKTLRVDALALELARVRGDKEGLFMCYLFLFCIQSKLGQWEAAAETWNLLNPMGRGWSRLVYSQGYAEILFAYAQFWQGTLREGHLTEAATLAEKDNNRIVLRYLHSLRGEWQLEQGEWELAAESFLESLLMARERRLTDEMSEAGLALAKFHLGKLNQPDEVRQEAERLADHRQPYHRYLAMLWLVIDDQEQAKKHALEAYKWGWADGEPYVHRYELTRTTELLREMNITIPDLPPYDPVKEEPFPWEADVRAAIEKIRANKEGKKRKKK